jgi:hypothetical protein
VRRVSALAETLQGEVVVVASIYSFLQSSQKSAAGCPNQCEKMIDAHFTP